MAMAGEQQQADKIVKSVLIRAPRAKVWKALTTMEDFARWFRVKSPDQFKAGTRVNMTSTYSGCEGMQFWADVVEMVPERRFSWRWFPGGPNDGPVTDEDKPTLVTFELEDAEGGTKVTVTESEFNNVSAARRAKAFKSNTQGWEIQMQNIREYVEKG
jgi:uncharacterized protein YndB with AHSA1/START domain